MNAKRYLLLYVILTLIVVPATNAALLSHWKFDTDANDYGTQAQNGTLMGNAHIVSETGPDGSSGYLELDGDSDYVDIPSATTNWTYTATVTAWVRMGSDDPIGDAAIYAQDWFSATNGTIQLFYGDTELFIANSYVNCNGKAPAAPTRWFHVAWVYPGVGAYVKIYVNGAEAGSTWNAWVPYSQGMLKSMGGTAAIGSWAGTGNYLHGAIDDVRIYDEALSQATIRAMIPKSNWPPEDVRAGLGVQTNFDVVDANNRSWYGGQLDAMSSVGADVVRFTGNVNWDTAVRDPNDANDWTYTIDSIKELVDMSFQRGLRPMIVMHNVNGYYEDYDSVRTAGGRNAYAAYCSTIATEFAGRGVIYDMWNESNTDAFWSPAANNAEYMAMLIAGVNSIKTADANAIIIGPSCAGFDHPWIQSCLDANLLDYVTDLSVHPYHPAGAAPEDAIGTNYPDVYADMNNANANFTGHIVNSELGYSEQIAPGSYRDEVWQARLVTRSVLSDLVADVPLHVHHKNRDESASDRNEQWGLVDVNGVPKASFYAYQTLSKEIGSMTFTERLSAEPKNPNDPNAPADSNDNWIAVFTDGNDSTVAVWVRCGDTTSDTTPYVANVDIPCDANSVVDMDGDLITTTPTVTGPNGVNSGYITMTISSEPRYIRLMPKGAPDTKKPAPDPMTFLTYPYATSSSSISMTATTASDWNDVEYYFDETSGNAGGSDSGWQDSTSYTDTGLSPGTQYTYQVKARDKSSNQNETAFSTTASATTTGATPTFVAAGSVASGTGTIAPALPAGIATGDILLLFLETSNQAISISNQNGGTWTQVTNSPQYCGTAAGTTGARLTAFWSRYNGTQGAPTASDSGNHQLGRMIAIRGAVASGNPWDVTAGGVEAVSDTSGSISGATTTVTNTLVVTAIATSLPDASSTAKFSAWTNANLTSVTECTDNSVTAGNGGGLGVATGIRAATGAYGNTAVTLVNAAYKGMMSIAIKP
ncbi:MAG: hypothetical protein A2Y13_03960 [Planctomycetes bacterium GWC2_45_44]|nr:MAG: hypothetical protein A2Y13_03960 [Planctomycetes bacterium GWC2_45_44]